MLQELGHEVLGVTMTLGRADEELNLAAARLTAEKLGIRLEVFDFAELWRKNVADYIRETYMKGETPNPCVRCNESVKMNLLPRAAFALGCDRFATGHYARLGPGGNGRTALMRAKDRTKDQSYFLYRVDSEILDRTLFPLGTMTKAEVREYARLAGIECAEKPDSQDFCGGDVLAFAGTEERPGDIVDLNGRKLGTHRGFWRYTVGKRKGLGIGGGTPYYVTALDAAENKVIVGFRESAAVHRFKVDNAVIRESLAGELSVKTRSAGEPSGPVTVTEEEDGILAVECESGLMGVAPGQSAVFYRGDEVIGGGIIRASTTPCGRVPCPQGN
jgi:tRNA-specific 2-thiouridylase